MSLTEALLTAATLVETSDCCFISKNSLEFMTIFQSDRKFTLISYEHSALGRLLFQSWRTKSDAIEIDLSFSDARAFELRPFCEGLSIEIDDAIGPSELRSKLGAILEPGLHIYVLRTKEWEGYVVAGTFHHDESTLVFTNRELNK
jgi:hypothetical protein